MTKPITRKTTSATTGQTQDDIYARVTSKILTDLENGNLSWRKPWHSEHMTNQVMQPLRWNDIPYTGINTLILWNAASDQGFTSPYWMTFKQATDMKASVRKGEKGTQIVYADKFTKEEEDANGDLKSSQIPFLKSYTVFNASQIEGLSDGFYKTPEPVVINGQARDPKLEGFFAQTKADIYTGSKACYTQSTDRIQMPPFESFETAMRYYAVLAHEICHWTKPPHRLNRDFGKKHYGDEGYAKEELTAELGACFLAADLGFEPQPEEHHAAYIQSWLHVLKDDKRFIFQAASHAQKAVEYIYALQSPRP
ncbi:zincin-like metallopeptidase domain-containing protein [Spirosoma sp. SC4-14]|uniref:ArdC family protein n=1 Tax=Spirosoma sp. SC4-14 TaxID=3128900 RepID=UPI0030D5C6FC